MRMDVVLLSLLINVCVLRATCVCSACEVLMQWKKGRKQRKSVVVSVQAALKVTQSGVVFVNFSFQLHRTRFLRLPRPQSSTCAH